MQFPSLGMRTVLALGMVACTACTAMRLERDGSLERPRAAAAGAYAQWRFIGIRRPGLASCPDAGSAWKGSPLLTVVRRPDDNAAARAAIEELERFCVYEPAASRLRAAALLASGTERPATGSARGNAGKDLPLPPPPRAGGDLVQIDPDVAALAASSLTDNLPAMTAPVLQQQFEREAGMVGTLPVAPPSLTRLSFLDTQPTGVGVPTTPGKSGHGYTLAHIGGELLCGNPPGAGPSDRPCAQIATQLAMPRSSFDAQSQDLSAPDDGLGGYLGTLTDLAQAITAAVESWKECRSHHQEGRDCSGAGEHLVLNLSLGWDGERFGGLQPRVKQFPTPVQAVHGALRLAAARGVLVIAAAGNVNGGTPDQAGPLLPAAWDRRPRASKEQPGIAGPLVYAVGAVKANGRPLGNMRPKAMPPLAAFGDHAVVDGLPAMTGTSVAAAVVSATAAAVWDYQPSLDRNQVMALVAKSASPLGYTADFGWSPSATSTPPATGQVRLCPALALACTGASCGPAWAPPQDCGSALSPEFPAQLDTAQGDFQPQRNLDGTQFQTMQFTPPVCTPATMHYTGSLDSQYQVLCPDENYPGAAAEPWVYPQPEMDPCPTCTMSQSVGGKQQMSVSAAFVLSAQHAPPAGAENGRRSSFARNARNAGSVSGAAGAAGPAASPPAVPWTLRLKIRDSWQPCPTAATLELVVIAGGAAGKRISYAIDGPLCQGSSLELSGIAVPAGARIESAWLTFLENGLAVRSQLLVAQ